MAGGSTTVTTPTVAKPPPSPEVIVMTLAKLNPLVVFIELLPLAENTPPVNDPRLFKAIPLSNDPTVTVPLVIPPVDVRAVRLVPKGLMRLGSDKIIVNVPAPRELKSLESKLRNAG